jgi:hypothetical protein
MLLRALAWLPLTLFVALVVVVTLGAPAGVAGGDYALASLEAAEHGRLGWPALAVLVVDVGWLVSIVAFAAHLARHAVPHKARWFVAIVFVPPIALPLYARRFSAAPADRGSRSRA